MSMATTPRARRGRVGADDRRPPRPPARLAGRSASSRSRRTTPPRSTRTRTWQRNLRSGYGRAIAPPLELARAIVLVAIAILAITIVFPALLEIAAGPFR